MTSFVHLDYSTQHPGVARVESAIGAAQHVRRGFSGSRGLSTLLLSAIAAAVMVVAYQVMDTVAEGHMLVVWMALWATAFVVLAVFASSVRTLSCSILRGLDNWSAASAQAKADQRLWAMARADSRVMNDLQSAMTRSDNDFDDAAASAAMRAMNARRTLLRSQQRNYI
jgi:hypothetical protein